MNSGVSILFRAIPLIMAIFCFAFGLFIFHNGSGGGRFMGGLVVFASGIICVALFCNTELMVRQIAHAYGRNMKHLLLTISYLITIATIISGIYICAYSSTFATFVTGHTIVGMGLISACLATVATASTRLNLLFINSQHSGTEIPEVAFSLRQERILEAIVVAISVIAWIWAFLLLINSHAHPAFFVAGHIMAGIACICTSLIAIVAIVVRQTRNVYTEKERIIWLELVLIMGAVSIIWGTYVMFGNTSITNGISGYIMIGLGLVCYSILGKIIAFERAWKQSFKLSNLILLIPFLAAAICFLLSVFIFEYATLYPDFIIPARALASLGGICVAFVPITSILANKLVQ